MNKKFNKINKISYFILVSLIFFFQPNQSFAQYEVYSYCVKKITGKTMEQAEIDKNTTESSTGKNFQINIVLQQEILKCTLNFEKTDNSQKDISVKEFNKKAPIEDSWSEFYSKYKNKFFIITFNAQKYFIDGTSDPMLFKEYGFSIISTNKVRRFGRDTIVATNEQVDNYDYVIEKNSLLSRNSSLSVSVNIEKDKLVLNLFNNKIKTQELTVNILGNICKSSFKNIDTNYNNKFEIENLTCKIID